MGFLFLFLFFFLSTAGIAYANAVSSVTALRANFWHVPDLEGPLDLDS
jgi:hypothetical protein